MGGASVPPFPLEIEMKIEMLTALSGLEYSYGPGDKPDFPDKEAIRLIDAGFAIPVRKSNKKKEKAIK